MGGVCGFSCGCGEGGCDQILINLERGTDVFCEIRFQVPVSVNNISLDVIPLEPAPLIPIEIG